MLYGCLHSSYNIHFHDRNGVKSSSDKFLISYCHQEIFILVYNQTSACDSVEPSKMQTFYGNFCIQ